MSMSIQKVRRFHKIFLLILVAAFISGCPSTFTYRDIQKDFNNAVQAENVQSVEAIGALSSSSQAGYEDVLQRLNDKYIESLDPKLRINAYTMKAVAQWRTGYLPQAKETADYALKRQDLPAGARDKMVLQIIKPLVNDQYLGTRYRQSKQKVSWTEYQNIYALDFADAAAKLNDAAAQATPDLPEDVVFYVYYQRWRVLENWRTVINSLESDENRTKAREGAKQALKGVALNTEIDNQKKKISDGHWLRRYIEFKEKQ